LADDLSPEFSHHAIGNGDYAEFNSLQKDSLMTRRHKYEAMKHQTDMTPAIIHENGASFSVWSWSAITQNLRTSCAHQNDLLMKVIVEKNGRIRIMIH
jgi:hypothetical protein